jgi:hypothetical protein
MDGGDYADSIRIDKPKTVREQIKIIHKKVLFLAFKNTPIIGWYIILSFFLITQAIVLMRPYPPNMLIDILSMAALVCHTYLYIRLLRRYIILEIKYFQNEIKNMEGEYEDDKYKDR